MDTEYKYQDFIKENGYHFPTSIHTRINDHYRISTIYRNYETGEGTMYGYETFIWECNDKEDINNDHVAESETHYSIEAVLKYHYDKYMEYNSKLEINKEICS